MYLLQNMEESNAIENCEKYKHMADKVQCGVLTERTDSFINEYILVLSTFWENVCIGCKSNTQGVAKIFVLIHLLKFFWNIINLCDSQFCCLDPIWLHFEFCCFGIFSFYCNFSFIFLIGCLFLFSLLVSLVLVGFSFVIFSSSFVSFTGVAFGPYFDGSFSSTSFIPLFHLLQALLSAVLYLIFAQYFGKYNFISLF